MADAGAAIDAVRAASCCPGTLLAFDASALALEPQLLAEDVDRDLLRSVAVEAALVGACGSGGGAGDASAKSTLMQGHVFDLRCQDLGGVLSSANEGAGSGGECLVVVDCALAV